MDNVESRLLKNIAGSPWAEAPRLEYADWIEQHGDKSRSEQAEFLRLDVEHEQIKNTIGGAYVYDPAYNDRFSEIRRRLRDLHSVLDPAWLIHVDRNLAIPPELSLQGKKAAQLILEFLLAEGLTGTGGCQAFYSPEQWKEAREKFGHDALLILVYDGGDIDACMDSAKGRHELVDRFSENLEQNGFVIEPCTHWYSAIYDERDYKPFHIELG